jgi:methylglyoxal synthase
MGWRSVPNHMNDSSPGPWLVFSRFAVGRGLWPLVRRTPKSVSNTKMGPGSSLSTPQQRRVPLTCLITNRKRIALVAHDDQKDKLARWASRQRERLVEHELYATAHTADVIAATLNVPVFSLLSGPLGGDQQIGSRIAESRIDVLVFFWDPFGVHPHDCDVKALLRLAAVYNIPNACNEATADCIISALDEGITPLANESSDGSGLTASRLLKT